MIKETINHGGVDIILSISDLHNDPSSENKYCNVHFEKSPDYTVLHVGFSLKFLLINKEIDTNEIVRQEIDKLLTHVSSVDSLFETEERFVFYTSAGIQNTVFHPFKDNN